MNVRNYSRFREKLRTTSPYDEYRSHHTNNRVKRRPKIASSLEMARSSEDYKRSLVPVYFNAEAYLQYCNTVNERGQKNIMATSEEVFETFLQADRHWEGRAAIYNGYGEREGKVPASPGYEAFSREVEIVFTSVRQKEKLLKIIYRSSLYIPLRMPIIHNLKYFLTHDRVHVFNEYERRNYELEFLTEGLSRNPAREIEATARKTAIHDAVKVGDFYVANKIVPLREMYRASILYQSVPLLLMLQEKYANDLRTLKTLQDDKGARLPVLLHIASHFVPTTGPLNDSNYLNAFKMLTEIHGGINDRDTEGESVIYRAALSRNEDVIRYLLDMGVDLQQETNLLARVLMLRLTPALIAELIRKGVPVVEETKYVFCYLGNAEYRNEVNAATRDVLCSQDYMRRAETERQSGYERFYRKNPTFDPDEIFDPNIIRYRGKKPR